MSSKGWGCCWENNWTAILKPALSCKLALVWSFPTVATKSALGKRSDYHTRLLSKCRSTVLKQWGNFSHLSAAKVVFIYARCSTHISHVSNPCITCHSATCFTVGSITHRIFVNSFFFSNNIHTYIKRNQLTSQKVIKNIKSVFLELPEGTPKMYFCSWLSPDSTGKL